MRVVVILLACFFSLHSQKYDLTLVGAADRVDSFGQITLGIIEQLKEDVSINYKYRCPPNLEEVGEDVKAILLNPDKSPGRVSLLTTPLWHIIANDSQLVPKSLIKIAYSMIECSQPPDEWVEILNRRFDAVVVPDPFLIDVYSEAGVSIPIFCIPIGMHLDSFFKEPEKERSHDPFVFGSTVAYDQRKNYLLLVEAFAREFSPSENVILKINGRIHIHMQSYLSNLENLVDALGASHVFLTNHRLDRPAFVEFMKGFDCFVNVSRGEGFSFCPREAFALGIPCILTNNTAQMTICETGFVRSVPSPILVPTDYNGLFGDKIIGYQYDCELQDVRAALRDVYENYSHYLQKAQEGREWVKQYQWENVKKRFLNLVKPRKILLGKRNVVTDDYLMTNSRALYNKYKKLTQKKRPA